MGDDAGGPRLRWTDDHCHLPEDPAAAAEAVAAAAAVGVERLIDVGTDLASSRRAIDRAGRFAAVWPTVGVHPHDARALVGPDGTLDGQRVDELAALAATPGVVGVGECGFDFHYDHSPRDAQRDVFALQVALAHQLDLALVIHTREAWPETFAVLEAEGVPERTVLHCFTGGPDEARRCLDLGAVLSFSGIVSLPSAEPVRAAAALCPLDRLLVETDSPYLAPVPHRGKRNRPAWVTDVGRAVAEVKGVDVEAVAEASWATAESTYRLV